MQRLFRRRRQTVVSKGSASVRGPAATSWCQPLEGETHLWLLQFNDDALADCVLSSEAQARELSAAARARGFDCTLVPVIPRRGQP